MKLPTAWVTRVILLLCIGIQLVLFIMGPRFENALLFTGGLIPARFSGAVVGLSSPISPMLTLVTHMFLHGGLAHLAMNMVFFQWVGRPVEWALGSARFLLLFLVAGLAGGILQALTSPHSVVPIVGASGAISGVFAVYLLTYGRSDEVPATILGISLSAEVVRALRYVALWIGLQLLIAVAFNEGGQSGIAIWSHIGGFLAGLLYGVAFARRRRI